MSPRTDSKAAVLQFFARERCSAILRTRNEEAVRPAMEAAVEGGFRIVEFTLNTPRALEHVAAFAKSGELLVGAGTVLSVDDAERAVQAGARFLVSPVMDPAVVTWCKMHDVFCVPGTYTPTEMLLAHRAGADLVKLFPAPADGPAYVRACLGPMPFLRVFPTSGVTEENAHDYLQAGAFGVGFVGHLFQPQDLDEGMFGRILVRARRLVKLVKGEE